MMKWILLLIFLPLANADCCTGPCPSALNADLCVNDAWNKFREFLDFDYIISHATDDYYHMIGASYCVNKVFDYCPRGADWEAYLVQAGIFEYFSSHTTIDALLGFLSCVPAGSSNLVIAEFISCLMLSETDPCVRAVKMKACFVSSGYKYCNANTEDAYATVADVILQRYNSYYNCLLFIATTTTTTVTTTPTTTTTTPSTTTTTTISDSEYNYCYSCISGTRSKACLSRCPAPWNEEGWNQTRMVRCAGPCMWTITATSFGDRVVRGCSDDFPQDRIRDNRCTRYGDTYVCFCSGDGCNKNNIRRIKRKPGCNDG